jgi:hypothetical protein
MFTGRASSPLQEWSPETRLACKYYIRVEVTNSEKTHKLITVWNKLLLQRVI